MELTAKQKQWWNTLTGIGKKMMSGEPLAFFEESFIRHELPEGCHAQTLIPDGKTTELQKYLMQLRQELKGGL